jgi:hypothetical protein
MKDCTCLTHDGPHWLHMDTISKAQNHELFEQALRYEQAGRASRDVAESALLFSMFIATIHCHAQAELSRMAEKVQAMEREIRENAIATAAVSGSQSK